MERHVALVIVGGHARKVGKTAVAAAAIAAFPQLNWTAVKITHHDHDARERPFVIFEEEGRSVGTDTSRFLAAGARRSLWIRVEPGRIGDLMTVLEPLLDASPSVIIESNSILEFVNPDLVLFVLRFDVSEFKSSAHALLSRADAVVEVNRVAGRPSFEAARRLLAHKKAFPVSDPDYMSPDLLRYLSTRLVQTKE
jgi:hypothetical protein